MEKCRKQRCNRPRDKVFGSRLCRYHRDKLQNKRYRSRCAKSGCSKLRVDNSTRCVDHPLNKKSETLCTTGGCMVSRFNKYPKCEEHWRAGYKVDNRKSRGGKQLNQLFRVAKPARVVKDTRSPEELELVRIRARENSGMWGSKFGTDINVCLPQASPGKC